MKSNKIIPKKINKAVHTYMYKITYKRHKCVFLENKSRQILKNKSSTT